MRTRIILREHVFSKHTSRKNITYWKCMYKLCKVLIKIQDNVAIINGKEHDHPPLKTNFKNLDSKLVFVKNSTPVTKRTVNASPTKGQKTVEEKRYIYTTKSNKIIIFNGCRYYCGRRNSSFTYYRCISYHQMACKSVIRIKCDTAVTKRIMTSNEHNHPKHMIINKNDYKNYIRIPIVMSKFDLLRKPFVRHNKKNNEPNKLVTNNDVFIYINKTETLALYEGYKYQRGSSFPTATYYKCVQTKSSYCKGVIKIKKDAGLFKNITHLGNHNHEKMPLEDDHYKGYTKFPIALSKENSNSKKKQNILKTNIDDADNRKTSAYILISKSSRLVLFEGYSYRKDQDCDSYTKYRCTLFQENQCKAILRLNHDNNSSVNYMRSFKHNHKQHSQDGLFDKLHENYNKFTAVLTKFSVINEEKLKRKLSIKQNLQENVKTNNDKTKDSNLELVYFTKSKRNALCLIYQDYLYARVYNRPGRIYFICTTKQCKGSASLIKDTTLALHKPHKHIAVKKNYEVLTSKLVTVINAPKRQKIPRHASLKKLNPLKAPLRKSGGTKADAKKSQAETPTKRVHWRKLLKAHNQKQEQLGDENVTAKKVQEHPANIPKKRPHWKQLAKALRQKEEKAKENATSTEKDDRHDEDGDFDIPDGDESWSMSKGIVYFESNNSNDERLVYEDHSYKMHADDNYWKCTQYKNAKCNAHVKLIDNTLYVYHDNHTHSTEDREDCEESHCKLVSIVHKKGNLNKIKESKSSTEVNVSGIKRKRSNNNMEKKKKINEHNKETKTKISEDVDNVETKFKYKKLPKEVDSRSNSEDSTQELEEENYGSDSDEKNQEPDEEKIGSDYASIEKNNVLDAEETETSSDSIENVKNSDEAGLTNDDENPYRDFKLKDILSKKPKAVKVTTPIITNIMSMPEEFEKLGEYLSSHNDEVSPLINEHSGNEEEEQFIHENSANEEDEQFVHENLANEENEHLLQESSANEGDEQFLNVNTGIKIIDCFTVDSDKSQDHENMET